MAKQPKPLEFVLDDNNYFMKSRSTPMESLPSGFYDAITHQKDDTVYYGVTPMEPFRNISKCYGTIGEEIEAALQMYEFSDNKPFSVMMTGRKGSGKTMGVKTLANRFMEIYNGIVLTVNMSVPATFLASFIRTVDQPVMVIFDEFDKTHYTDDEYQNKGGSKDKQSDLLGLLDGVIETSKAFYLFTLNDTARVNKFMIDRPGRIAMKVEFDIPDAIVSMEMARDMLSDPADLTLFAEVLAHYSRMSFDATNVVIKAILAGVKNKRILTTSMNIEFAGAKKGYAYRWELETEAGNPIATKGYSAQWTANNPLTGDTFKARGFDDVETAVAAAGNEAYLLKEHQIIVEPENLVSINDDGSYLFKTHIDGCFALATLRSAKQRALEENEAMHNNPRGRGLIIPPLFFNSSPSDTY